MNNTKAILLICANGLSTSMLVEQMNRRLKSTNQHYVVKCCDVVSAMIEIYNADLVLLAPQISYAYDRIALLTKELDVPLFMIDIEDYRHFDGVRILERAMKQLDDHFINHPFKVVILSPKSGGVLMHLVLIDMKKYIEKEQLQVQVENEMIELFMPGECRGNVVLIESQCAYLSNNIFPYLNKYTAFGIINKELMASFSGRLVLEYAISCYDEMIERRKSEVIAEQGEIK